MKHVHLGRTGLRVSNLCLGTMNFGPHTTEPDSYAIMDRALEINLNFFDTADVYGWKAGEGVTEQIVGRWWAQGGGRREKVVIATKVYGEMNLTGQSDPNLKHGLSARKIIACCENSLKRLKTDYIDILQMHHVDRTCPFDEIWQAMETLVAQGKIIYSGSSNFAGWDIATAQQTAAHRHFIGLASEQSVYSLENRTIELEVIPACRHYGLGVIPWSPLSGGLLAGALEKQAAGRRAHADFEKRVEKKRAQLEKYEGYCKKLGERPADIGIAWLLHNPVVTAPIIGPRTVEQLNSSLHATDIVLSAESMKTLDEIWPGPGGEAPNAYSW
jgi:aryl-alcohol dehydrogenase-like predicted oxidoreductase